MLNIYFCNFLKFKKLSTSFKPTIVGLLEIQNKCVYLLKLGYEVQKQTNNTKIYL